MYSLKLSLTFGPGLSVLPALVDLAVTGASTSFGSSSAAVEDVASADSVSIGSEVVADVCAVDDVACVDLGCSGSEGSARIAAVASFFGGNMMITSDRSSSEILWNAYVWLRKPSQIWHPFVDFFNW